MTLSKTSREDLPNPRKTEEVVAQGSRLWSAINQGAPELRDIVWLLLEEAAQTMRSLPGDGPSSKTGFWPEIVWQLNEIQQAYNEQNTEEREAAKEKRIKESIYVPDKPRAPAPSAAAIGRFLTVMDWLRAVRCRNHKSLRMQLVLSLAAGLSPTRAAQSERYGALNFRSRQAVLMFKQRALNNIEESIRKECPKIIVGSYI